VARWVELVRLAILSPVAQAQSVWLGPVAQLS
jgi:hypothetical protein